MNEWFAGEWTGVSQTFQLIRTVKRRQRKLREVEETAEQIPARLAGKRKKPQKLEGSSKLQEPIKPTKPAKQAKSSKKPKKQVVYVEETSQQVVYGLTNLTPTEAPPEAIAAFARAHWAIENRLHWRRNVTLREDHSQVRTAGRPEALAALNNVVLALMDWLRVRNVPEQMRIFNACPQLALALLLGPLTFE